MEAVLKTVELIAPGVRIPHHPKINIRRDAREAEGNGLLNRGTVSVPRVRIPLSPKNNFDIDVYTSL